MDVLIVRDGGSTKVPRVVADMAEVEGLRAAGLVVEVLGEPPAVDAPQPVKPAKPPKKPKA